MKHVELSYMYQLRIQEHAKKILNNEREAIRENIIRHEPSSRKYEQRFRIYYIGGEVNYQDVEVLYRFHGIRCTYPRINYKR